MSIRAAVVAPAEPAEPAEPAAAAAPASVAETDPEPSSLLCPITHTMYRDPVVVPESGNTYERSAVERFWRTSHAGAPPRDMLSNSVLNRAEAWTNWDKRREVIRWLDDNPTRTPDGWDSREMAPARSGPMLPPNAQPFSRVREREPPDSTDRSTAWLNILDARRRCAPPVIE